MAMTPLPDALRPTTFDGVVGQEHTVHHLKASIAKLQPISILLWGPPGCGKTTLARLYAKAFDPHFLTFSGAYSGSVEIKKLLKEIKDNPLFSKRRAIFIDEIHRFNKAQQDIFLPYIEDGTIILIGATTENPSFSLNDALLSRLRVFQLEPLKDEHLLQILTKTRLTPTPETTQALLKNSAGDARHFINAIETLLAHNDPSLITKRCATYDKNADGHHNLISALHKSVRGSDPDAAIYWLARMLVAGEDPNYIARRLMRMAAEDIGLADPQALTITLNAWQAFERMGPPEGELALAEATIYLALAPKSNATYTAFKAAKSLAQETTHYMPPKHILNAPTKLMKNQGYGKGYIYDHDTESGCSGQNYFPEEIEPSPTFYKPVERGFEREMQKRLLYFSKLKKGGG